MSYNFESEEFDDISDEAKSFIRNLLVNRMDERLTAEETLHHPWLSTETKRVMKSLKKDNLRVFLARRRWQKGAQAVLALKRIVSASVIKSDYDESSTSSNSSFASERGCQNDERTICA